MFLRYRQSAYAYQMVGDSENIIRSHTLSGCSLHSDKRLQPSAISLALSGFSLITLLHRALSDDDLTLDHFFISRCLFFGLRKAETIFRAESEGRSAVLVSRHLAGTVPLISGTFSVR